MIDIICILIIGIYTYLGWKRGIIRSAVSLIGTFIVCVLSWTLKDVLASFLIEKMPFFNFAGIFNGISAINILIYQVISFVIIFVVLYCLLNIVINLSKIVDKLIKLTLVFALPSKILGAILGLIEGIVTAFLLIFVLFHVPFTTSMVNDSKLGLIILERTPIIGNLSVPTTLSLEEIERIIANDQGSNDIETKNLKVLHTLISYKLITAEDAQKLIDSDKMHFNNTIMFNQGG